MANDFNPDPFKGISSAPSSLGASRGRSPVAAKIAVQDKSKGADIALASTLLKDATGLGLNIAKKVDESNLANQRMEFQGEIEEINNSFGVGAATTFASSEVPGQIKAAHTELTNMKKAQAAGKLSESHYWGRVQAAVRKLRAKHPSYRDEIDKMVSNVTGTRPANALRRALMAESRKVASASSSQANRIARLREYMVKEGIAPASMAARIGTDKEHTYEQLLDITNRAQRSERNIQILEKKAGLEMKNIGLQNARVNVAQQEAAMALRAKQAYAFKVASEPLFGSTSEFQQTLKRLDARRAKGEVLPQAELNQVRQAFGQWKNQVINTYNENSASAVGRGMNEKNAASVSDFFKARLNDMEQALTNEKFGFFTYNKVLTEGAEHTAVANLIQNNPHAAALMAAQKVAGQSGVDKYLQGIGSNAVFRKGQIVEGLIGHGKSAAELMKEAADKGLKGHEATMFIISTAKKAIRDKTAKIDEQRNAVNSLYGEGNRNFLFDLKSEDQYKAFQDLTNETMATRIKELSKDDPNLWIKYRRWTLNSFQALLKSKIDETQNVVLDSRLVNLTYDKNVGQFELKAKPQPPRTLGTGSGVPSLPSILIGGLAVADRAAEESIVLPQQKKAVADLNQALLGLLPVLRQEGGDPITHLNAIAGELGIKLDAKPREGFVEGIWNSILKVGQPTGSQDLRGRSNLGLNDIRPTVTSVEPIPTEPRNEKDERIMAGAFFNVLERKGIKNPDEKAAFKRLGEGTATEDDRETLAALLASGRGTTINAINQEVSELKKMLKTTSNPDFRERLQEEVDSLEASKASAPDTGVEVEQAMLWARKVIDNYIANRTFRDEE